MSKTMADVLLEAMRDHRVLWEIGLDEDKDLVSKCESCGYLSAELDTYEHQSNVAAEVLSAAGFGPVHETKAEALTEAADAIATPDMDPETCTKIYDPWDVADYLRARAAAIRGEQ